MVRIEDLSPEGRRKLLSDVRAGHIGSNQIGPGAWVHDDPSSALDALIDMERKRASGEDIDVLLIGEARIFNDMREIVRQMVQGEKHSQEYPYFTKNDMGIWEHISNNQCKIHLVVPDRDGGK